ncbi:class I adenylate-forming enzyme family protein [Actinomadura livida]|uniref:Acyl-coenzyme A synthetase/AMP-(Fatty) acid ligase n=1 Tax=Actinomadura livida TaxID=79909 RepID=A0A7W7ID85_9ACTN|nr:MULTISPECIES: class I adenylate-forming enzyme family protein [Actinomadura]MBB4774719.1 acyl-coenzyme A synthetase/AMP-(fatty) acid ligase [Actinomadura catellatispora]GGU06437.1 hypothetical protein GCM10010208_33540 [Actinomadura livida]
MATETSTGHETADHETAGIARLRAVLDPALDVPGVLTGSDWTTWGQLGRCAESIAARLDEIGAGAGCPVVLVLRNRPSGVAALLGTLAHGRVPVLASSLHPAPQIRAIAVSAGAGAVVLDEEDHAAGLDRELAAEGVGSVVIPSGSGEAVVSARTVAAASEPAERRASAAIGGGVAMIVPTSGTTGAPKQIPVRWEQIPFDPAAPIRRPHDPAQRPPVVQALSMATITGVRGVLAAVARERSIALLERVDVEEWTKLVERFGVRRTGLPPAAMRMMLDAKVPPRRLLGMEAWLTGSAPLEPGLQREFEEYFGVPVLVAYGSTELGGSVAGWTLGLHREWRDRKLGSVGRARAGVRLRIVDESTGEPVPEGEPGILTVRSPATAGTGDGWFRTSDRARIDADGFLFILERADDVVIRGGFKVSLGELEDLFRRHPAVLDAGAVGLPDERLGRLPAVGVVLGRETSVTADDLRAWAIERTARYKVPRIAVVPSLPMGASHKVDRTKLAAVLGPLVGPDAAEGGA